MQNDRCNTELGSVSIIVSHFVNMPNKKGREAGTTNSANQKQRKPLSRYSNKKIT